MRELLRRHLLWVGLAAVLVPLSVMLVMQYRWLASLEKTSAIARRAGLANYLEAVSNEVEYFYRKEAERNLNIPADAALRGADKIEQYFSARDVEGARVLFVAMFDGEGVSELVTYDARSGGLRNPDPATWQAISVALSPWKTLALKQAPLASHALTVEERAPDRPIVVSPITSDGCRVLGVAGMVIDEDYFHETILPLVVDKAMLKFFRNEARTGEYVVSVRDGRDRLVMGEDEDEVRGDEASRALSFVFTDHRVTLGFRRAGPEQWARSNFTLNVSLSALLGVALLGGVVLALRTASREMKLSQMKSDFVSNVSHELRTPIASIRVFGEFLRLGRVGERSKVREYGEYIETESRRLTQLIDNILDFSKIERGAKTYSFERADLRAALAEPLRTLEVSLRHQGFDLEVVDDGSRLPEIELDADAIAQALANLVDNAAKYSRDDKRITVRLGRQGGQAIVAVEDRGVGISRREQRKIFERFHRVSTGLVHDVKGSGLGLSIVSHIVRAHGGVVTVESEPARGSVFTIRLPLPAGERDEAVRGARSQPAAAGTGET